MVGSSRDLARGVGGKGEGVGATLSSEHGEEQGGVVGVFSRSPGAQKYSTPIKTERLMGGCSGATIVS